MSAFEKVPIVARTAYALPGDDERFLNMGFAAHLPEPFRPDELREILDRFDRPDAGRV